MQPGDIAHQVVKAVSGNLTGAVQVLSLIHLFILQVGGILNAGFDQIFNLYSPMVYDVGDILDTYVYRRGIAEGSDYSFTTAVGLFKNVIGFFLVIVTNRITKKISDNGIW